jgi:hypothetical protein
MPREQPRGGRRLSEMSEARRCAAWIPFLGRQGLVARTSRPAGRPYVLDWLGSSGSQQPLYASME